MSRRRVLQWGALGLAGAGAGSALVSTSFLSTLGGSADGARLDRMRRSPQFRDGKFVNLEPTAVMQPGSTWDTAGAWLTKGGRGVPPQPLPTVPVSRASFGRPSDDVRACWLGHSTVVLEIEGLRLLLDPVWSSRSSPSRWAGPARFQPNPLPLDEMPPLDAILVSHDHYDHLDHDAIRHLAVAFPQVPFVVPLGVGAHLEHWGVPAERIRELDWWEELPLGPNGRVRLHATPARHFSGRGVFDRNATLWTSWSLIGERRRVHFGGDGGYSTAFAEIGQRLGPFDLVMLEIGAWHPNWGSIHLGPDNALKAHRDLQGRKLLPVHWAAYDLGLHAWDEPIVRLAAEAPKAGVDLVAPRMGAVWDLQAPPAVEPWWTLPT